MLPPAAGAFEYDTGNEDLSIRWDNTVRANILMRAQQQDKHILASANFDDGDRNFGNGHTFERLDLLSEFDLVWKKTAGLRVSAAGWWDPGYGHLDNNSLATSNNLDTRTGLPVLGLTGNTKRYAEGPSAEMLDAFGFVKFTVGDAPVNVKLGQTTVYWGEGLYLGGAIHGIAYSQNPIDVWKGLSTPGAEAKELYRPRVGFNVQSQVSNTVSLAAQYFFNWQNFSNQAYRYPEAGSYLSVGDPLLFSGESYIIGHNPFYPAVPGSPAYLRAWRGKDIVPDENTGNYGVAMRWSPASLDATIGFYYRRTYDMQPQLMLTPGLANSLPKGTCQAIGGVSLAPAAAPPATAAPCIINQNATNLTDLRTKGKFGEYNVAFGKDIDIFGLSFSQNIGDYALGAELSYRKNMPLLSEAVQVLPAPLVSSTPGAIATTAVPSTGTPGALGDTMHGLVNLLGVMGKGPLWDTVSWGTELTWMTWLNVTQNEAVFKGRPSYTQIDAVSKNYFGLAINVTPTWFQVFPGVDMYAPLAWSQGISGNSAVTSGGQSGAGTFAAGVAWDIRQKYRFDLKYVGFYGNYSTCPRPYVTAQPGTCAANSGSADIFNGTNAILSDRGFVALTFKTTF